METTLVAQDGSLRWTCGEDDTGLFYLVYAGLDTLVYYGRSYREASKAYSAALRAGKEG